MPLLWLSLSFLSGVILGALLGWTMAVWLVLASIALVVLVLPRLLIRPFPTSRFIHHAVHIVRHSPPFPPPISYPLLLLFLSLGAARYQSTLLTPEPDNLAWYNDQGEMVIEGVIAAYPDQRDTYTHLHVQVSHLRAANEAQFKPVRGMLLARIPPGGDWQYGDRIRLTGPLESPPEGGEFSYRQYLAHKGIYTYLSCPAYNKDCPYLLQRNQGNPLLQWIYALRDRTLKLVYQLFPDPEASLLAGILLGVEAGIPQQLQQAFNETGTAHIIAISGFNFAIVAGLFALLFRRLLGKWRGLLASIFGITVYALLAGSGEAVVRAAWMGGLSLFATQIGRRSNGLNSLAFVAALLALHNPHTLWDVGFQLSCAATLGLVLYAEPITQALRRFAARLSNRWSHLSATAVQRTVKICGETILLTLAAQLTTLPIVLYHFQRLSLVSLLANPLILPAQPPVMVLGGLAVLLGLIHVSLGRLMAALAWPFAAYTIRMVEVLAELPVSSLLLGRIQLWSVIAFYIVLLSGTLAGTRIREWLSRHLGKPWKPPAFLPTVLALSLGAIAVLIWQMAFAAPDGLLHLHVLDVGNGEALLIRTPNGRNLLINGGPSPSRLSDALGRRMPFFNRGLDFLLVAGVGDEHLEALPRTVERYPPRQVVWAGVITGSRSARELHAYLTDAHIPIVEAQLGHTFDLGRGAVLRILAVGSRGMVLWLEWGNFSALLPVGLDLTSLEELKEDRRLRSVTSLLLAESGYAPLNPPEWIDRWHPQFILLSVAADDREGRPAPEVLKALQGYSLLRTDHNGWIELSTDGERLWVEVERK